MINAQTRPVDLDVDVVVTPLNAPLGAIVRCGKLSDLGVEGRKKVKQAYLDHLLLVIPGQNMSSDEQIQITDIFGETEEAILDEMKGKHHGVVVVANVPGGILGAGDLRWHSDHSFHERPASASLLQAMALPPSGGDTYWCNMYQALATLPAATRDRIRGLTVKNDGSLDSAGGYRGAPVTDVLTYKGPSHPLVRTHPETGYNALYLGRRPNAYINGLSVSESEKLLDELWEHAGRMEYYYKHRWSLGDLLVWDNRVTMHKRDAFDETQDRIMHRTQCRGELPTYNPAADMKGGHPRGMRGR